jgi:predicted RecA/RadA family phage recombinase
MPSTFKADGETVNWTTTGAVALGDVIELPAMIGIALAAATGSGEVIPLAVVGVWQLTKETGIAIAIGDKVYWDATNDRVDKTNTNIPCGMAMSAQGSADTTVEVAINFGPPA